MRIIPPLEAWGAVTSAAEKKVAHLFAQVTLDGPEVCLYSLHLPRHAYKRMSEVDFLVLTPQAVIVVEVKGGRIARSGGRWSFTDRYGVTNTKAEGPFDQARSAMFAFEEIIRQRLPKVDIAMGYLVLTPDQDLGDDIEWERVHHAGPAAMTVSGLERALRQAIAHWSTGTTTSTGYAELKRALRPDFDLVPTLASRAERLRAEYIGLADRQYELLAGAQRNPRILCSGGAGSGKTLLAVETAARSAREGRDVLLVCLSPALARYIGSALRHTTVRVRQFAEVTGEEPTDVLIVDEGQDLMDTDSYIALDQLVRGGLDNGTWRIFLDANNQAAVDGHFDHAVLDELEQRATLVDLPYNCRNTVPVVQQTQDVTGADLGVAKAGDGPSVEYVKAESRSGLATQLDAHLRRLRRDEVDLSTVAVVSLSTDIAASAAVDTKHMRDGRLRRFDGDPTAHTPQVATLMTAAEVKGLEYEHVCVIDVAEVTPGAWSSRLYVAMTRPTISLWIALDPLAWKQISEPEDESR